MKKAGNTRPERKPREGPGSKGVIPTPRQQAFVLAYMRTGNATQAAIESGYAPGCAKQRGDKLLKQPCVVKLINEYNARTEDEGIGSIKDVKRILWNIASDTNAEHKDRIAAGDKLLKAGGAYVVKHEVDLSAKAEVRVYLPSNGRDT